MVAPAHHNTRQASGRAVRAARHSSTRRVLPTAASRGKQLVELLRDEIIAGQIGVGEQLKQDVLCREFDLSPAPVREALRELESEGLVTHIPNRGVFVAEITTDDVFELLLPVRLMIERHALTKPIKRFTSEDFAELDAIVGAMDASAKKGELAVINELDIRFHEITVQASGSAQALQLWRSVQPRIRAQIYWMAPRHRRLEEIAVEHEELLAAIRSGSQRQLSRLIKEHIIGTNRVLLDKADGTAHHTGR